MRDAVDRPMPRRVGTARTLLAGVAVAHAIAVLVALGLQGAIADAIQDAQPALRGSEVHALVTVELVRTLSFHLLLIVVCSVYAAKIGSGRRRVLRIVTASQVLSVIFGIVTFTTASGAVRWSAPPFIAGALMILTLLLGSAQTRAFFATGPRHHRPTRVETLKPPAP